MLVILPVAGKGTRLRPHTHTRAKSLVQVAGKTVLEHIMSRLTNIPVREFVFITDENGAQIENFMQTHFPQMNCFYTVQHERLGPAHAVFMAADRVLPGEDVLVVFNDTIFVTDLTKIPSLSEGCDGLIYSKEVEDYQRFGVNVMRDGFIVEMVEKPEKPVSRLAQVGLYYLKDGQGFMQSIGEVIEAGETVKGEYFLPSVFMRMIRAGKKFRAPEIDAWLDCGKPETLLETNRYLLKEHSEKQGEIIRSIIVEPVHIGKGTVIRDSVVGPYVSVAPNCQIDGSLIRDTIINAESQVKNALLTQSLLGEHVRVTGHQASLNIGDHSQVEM
ncbi:MAG: NTP transferase domain-containing protein [Deltaproteobacteria bacterium]|nr:NTP transferase domain-containing protein [Deltaproteobacteria bacterium]